MKDYKSSPEEFFQNKGFSAKHFVSHVHTFITLLSKSDKQHHIVTEFRRLKIIMHNIRNGVKLVIRVHWKGKSRHYASVLTEKGKEILVVHSSMPPTLVGKLVLDLLFDDKN